MSIASMPAPRASQPTPQWGWLVLLTVLAIGVLNPLSCIIHCLAQPTNHLHDSDIARYLCLDPALMPTSLAFTDAPAPTTFQSPRVAPVFESYVLIAAVALAIPSATRHLVARSQPAYRLLVDPPLVPPPQHS